jgi:hypothetical protein
MSDLNTLPGIPTGWVLNTAVGINDSGVVAGMGTDPTGQSHGYLLYTASSPPPPPLTATSTSIDASASSVVYSQQVTLTATVSPVPGGSGTPTGSVTFDDGSVALGAAMLSNGTAVLPVSSLPVGSDAITASYSGDASFLESSSSAVNVSVQRDGTSIVVSSSTDPSGLAQAVTFTAVVSALAPGTGTPSGTVTFRDGGAFLGTGMMAGGIASFSTTDLSLGSHAITAVYAANANFLGSTSAALNQSVNAVINATRVALTGTPTVSTFGQRVVLTASVIPVSPLIATPTGTVTFRDGLAVLGVVPLGSAQASLTTMSLPPGVNEITAVYSGDPSFSGNTSPVLIETVASLPARTRASTSRRVSQLGHPVTFFATVSTTGRSKTIPTGSVSFWDGFALLGTAELTAGKASFSTSLLWVGTHEIRVTYNGQVGFSTSSASLKQTIKQPKARVSRIARLLGG